MTRPREQHLIEGGDDRVMMSSWLLSLKVSTWYPDSFTNPTTRSLCLVNASPYSLMLLCPFSCPLSPSLHYFFRILPCFFFFFNLKMVSYFVIERSGIVGGISSIPVLWLKRQKYFQKQEVQNWSKRKNNIIIQSYGYVVFCFYKDFWELKVLIETFAETEIYVFCCFFAKKETFHFSMKSCSLQQVWKQREKLSEITWEFRWFNSVSYNWVQKLIIYFEFRK